MEFQNKVEINISDYVTTGLHKKITRTSAELAELIRMALDEVNQEDRENLLSALLGAVTEDIDSCARTEAE